MKYNPQLDGLRCVAISLVLISHFFWQLGTKTALGFYGVDLFFVISGFLITSILLKSEEPFRKAYGKFIGRRTLRIFPIYYLTVFVLLLIGNTNAQEYKYNLLTYTYNYAMAYQKLPINELGHLWSLCVEEQFYLFWPFLVLGLRKKHTVLKCIIAFISVLCIIQVFTGAFNSIAPHNYFCLFPRLMTLLAGAYGAIIYKEGKIPKQLLESKTVETLALVLLIGLLSGERRIDYVAFPVVSLYLVLKIVHKGFSFSSIGKFLQNRRVVYIGTISYGIYLYHILVRHYFGGKFFIPQIWEKIDRKSLGIFKYLFYNDYLVLLPLYSALTLLVAHISFQYIEKPILALKEKWFAYEQEKGMKRNPMAKSTLRSLIRRSPVKPV
ncbi:acyltransferase family protein [Flavisolibacter nicotianae]|uniref:acyltransferase family protein n=1 Tax=Flavisolibacter nicotianae TaxID=2364882 RepID=UPI000EB22E93|nr:acyltransferase [Flavisolibacter nicotianae]